MAAHNGELFVFGGDYAGNGTTTVFVYTPNTDTWATKPNPIPAPINAASAAVLGGEIYLVGGTGSTTLHVYNPGGDTWITRASVPAALASASVGVIGGKLYVAGGWDYGLPGYSSSTYEYDPASDSWTVMTPAPNSFGGAAFGVIDNELYVAGGVVAGVSPAGNLNGYTPLNRPPVADA